MDKSPNTSPPRYERDGHSLTIENHFTGEKPLREALKVYLAAGGREGKP